MRASYRVNGDATSCDSNIASKLWVLQSSFNFYSTILIWYVQPIFIWTMEAHWKIPLWLRAVQRISDFRAGRTVRGHGAGSLSSKCTWTDKHSWKINNQASRYFNQIEAIPESQHAWTHMACASGNSYLEKQRQQSRRERNRLPLEERSRTNLACGCIYIKFY